MQNGLAGDQIRARKGCTLTMGLKQIIQGLKVPLGHRCGYSVLRSGPDQRPHTRPVSSRGARTVHAVCELPRAKGQGRGMHINQHALLTPSHAAQGTRATTGIRTG